MGTIFGVVIGLVVLAALVAQPLLVLFSRRYPRKPEGSGRQEPPAR
jgi:hypothetical protein